MSYRVLLTDDAVQDLEELYDYVFNHDSPAAADRLLTRVEKVVQSLSELPERGAQPPELTALGIRAYRQIFFKPYRIIYRVIDDALYVYLVADGRRDMHTLLSRRLLRR